jgi:hypothetical protein
MASDLESAQEFAVQLAPVMSTAFDYFTVFPSRSQILKFARLFVISSNTILFDDFDPWIRCIDTVENWREFETEFGKFVLRTVEFFCTVNKKNSELRLHQG